MNINLSCPVNQTGYGISSLNILKALVKSGVDISYFPIGSPSVTNDQDYSIVLRCLQKSQTFDINAPCVKIWHQFDLASRIGRGEYIAYPFFELDTFNNIEKNHLRVPDKLIASSEWAKNVIHDNGINTPVSIVPLGVDSSIFDHNIQRMRTNDTYVFLTIGKWEVRKGHDILPDLFKQAFPNEKDVELWILAAEHTSSYSTAEQIQDWKNLYKSDRIRVFPGLKNHTDIANLIAESDCGLYMSRAEGWNLELLETMAMNKPAIATNYSAHTEFCNPDNCFLVDVQETELANDGKAFKGQGNWAKIGEKQINQCIDYMRYLYKNRINTNLHGLVTAKKYSWENSASQLARCING